MYLYISSEFYTMPILKRDQYSIEDNHSSNQSIKFTHSHSNNQDCNQEYIRILSYAPLIDSDDEQIKFNKPGCRATMLIKNLARCFFWDNV